MEYGLPIRGRKVISHSETLNTGSAIITAGFRDIHRYSGMKEDLEIIALAPFHVLIVRLVPALYSCHSYVIGSYVH